jgi:hypothetical protein
MGCLDAPGRFKEEEAEAARAGAAGAAIWEEDDDEDDTGAFEEDGTDAPGLKGRFSLNASFGSDMAFLS